MGRNKKRWLALGLAGIMALGLTACGSSDSGNSDSAVKVPEKAHRPRAKAPEKRKIWFWYL